MTPRRTLALACTMMAAGTVPYIAQATAAPLEGGAGEPVATRYVCHEDAPCWNWATMGNHRRGIVTVFGARTTVSVCRYQRLARQGIIARRRPLAGDRIALRYPCGADARDLIRAGVRVSAIHVQP